MNGGGQAKGAWRCGEERKKLRGVWRNLHEFLNRSVSSSFSKIYAFGCTIY